MKKLSITFIFTVSVVLFFALFSLIAYALTLEPRRVTNEPLTEIELQTTITEAVIFLQTAQEPNGHFRYEYIPFLNRYVDDDNIVRQTGAFYVLGEVLRRDKEDKFELKTNMEKAITYFKANSISGVYNNYKFQCILLDSKKCNLGAGSLFLVGLLDYVEAYPELEYKYESLIEEYKNYILAMKKPGEGYRNYYYKNGECPKAESSYSNGEALLALARYYKYNPTDEVKKVIDASFNHFDSLYREDGWDYNFYLWGMAAVKSLYEIEPKQEYADFVKDYTEWRVSGYVSKRAAIGNTCAYIEGVASAFTVMETSMTQEEKDYYYEEINYWLTKNKDLQVNSDAFMWLSFNRIRARILRLQKPETAIGGFLTSLDEPVQRIDFTQHCLSSYLQKMVDIDDVKIQ